MSIPDPQAVREIARQQILDDRHRAHDNGSAVLGRFGPDGLTRPEYHAYCDAIREAIRTAQIAVSWPAKQQSADPIAEDDATVGTCTMDCVMGHTNEPGRLYDTTSKLAEQQPADVVTAEQQQDGAVEDVVAFLDAWDADRGFGNTIRGGNGDMPYLFATDLRAVLAERTALAARVAQLEGERKAATGFVAIWHDTALVQHEVDEIRCQDCRAYMAGPLPLPSPVTLADLVALAARHECLPHMSATETEES